MERAQKHSAALCRATVSCLAVPIVSSDAAALVHKDRDEKAAWGLFNETFIEL